MFNSTGRPSESTHCFDYILGRHRLIIHLVRVAHFVIRRLFEVVSLRACGSAKYIVRRLCSGSVAGQRLVSGRVDARKVASIKLFRNLYIRSRF